jgi:hypothetical protein
MQFREKKIHVEECDDEFHQNDDSETAGAADGETARTKTQGGNFILVNYSRRLK